MGQNRFCVIDIPGPHVMKMICEQLGYTPEQLALIKSLRPSQFPLYVYSDTSTRYWFGSNPSLCSAQAVNWREYLEAEWCAGELVIEDFENVEAFALDALESDTTWLIGRFKDLTAKIREFTGG